jgi:hypothetical protein
VLRTYIIRLNMAAFAMFSASRAGRNRINVRSELIDGVRDGKLYKLLFKRGWLRLLRA